MNNQDKWQSLAKHVKDTLNPVPGVEETGFILVTFGYGADGIGRYVASCTPEDGVDVLRQLADSLEQRTHNERYPFRES